ncbi:MAG: Unknown protein [uncultured Sulfurovum sp.]|uniref:DUF350 domain-containing protein n=1 Tax=uncultured Sulfurovum sp. TaxID=269237 RepID=A0A6S6TIN5_9BACT|nr:MAG: Unknown protein [uncultured Sulfurovum sp.]
METFQISGALSVLIYSSLGIAVFALVLLLLEVTTKYSINRKIAHDGNIALAIVLGSMIIAIGMIISAAIR